MSHARRFDLVVFDWDGTLMDSEAQIVSCIHQAVNDMGLLALTDDAVRNVIGLGLKEAIDTLVPGRDGDFHADFVDCYRSHWFASEASALFAGVHDTLELLRTRGYLMGVATGKGRPGLEKVLKETGIGNYFSATRCADETRSKPHPQMLHEIMLELAVSAPATLMVGDTVWDLEMGRQAGTATLAVSYGVHETDRLEACEPIALIHDLRELPDILDSYASDSGEQGQLGKQ